MCDVGWKAMNGEKNAICDRTTKTWTKPHTICVPDNFNHDKNSKNEFKNNGDRSETEPSTTVSSTESTYDATDKSEDRFEENDKTVDPENKDPKNKYIYDQFKVIKMCATDKNCIKSGDLLFPKEENGHCLDLDFLPELNKVNFGDLKEFHKEGHIKNLRKKLAFLPRFDLGFDSFLKEDKVLWVCDKVKSEEAHLFGNKTTETSEGATCKADCGASGMPNKEFNQITCQCSDYDAKRKVCRWSKIIKNHCIRK